MAVALNPKPSINFMWEQRFTRETSVSGSDVPGSSFTVGNLQVGAAYVFTPDLSLDFGVVIGLTQDAPDIQVVVSTPIRAYRPLP